MNSIRFLQCLGAILIAAIQVFCASQASDCCDLQIREKILQSEFKQIKKRLDKLNDDIEWLLKEREDCNKELQKIKNDLEQIC